MQVNINIEIDKFGDYCAPSNCIRYKKSKLALFENEKNNYNVK